MKGRAGEGWSRGEGWGFAPVDEENSAKLLRVRRIRVALRSPSARSSSPGKLSVSLARKGSASSASSALKLLRGPGLRGVEVTKWAEEKEGSSARSNEEDECSRGWCREG